MFDQNTVDNRNKNAG